MSGSQIGTVVGGVVGGVIGSFVPGIGTYAGAQLGMAVGGMVGGAIDPTKIYGPHIGDGQSQTATDGSSIAWVMGDAWVAGCIVDLGKRTEVEVDDDGKGSGTEQVTYEAHQSFSILVCESDELKGSTIQNVLMVEQDGKIVYDVRPGSKMLSDSLKWAANVTFMYGDEAQLPPTTFDGIHGADNEPAYRGVLLAIFSSFNLTAVGDRIPQFRFLVSAIPTYVQPQSAWRFLTNTDYSAFDTSTALAYVGEDLDDSGWPFMRAPFVDIPDGSTLGTDAAAAVDGFGDGTQGTYADHTVGSVARLHFSVSEPVDCTLTLYFCDWYDIYINGVSFAHDQGGPTKFVIDLPADTLRAGNNLVVVCLNNLVQDEMYFDLKIEPKDQLTDPTLEEVVTSICTRGGVTDIDATELATATVKGYAIAKQMNAVNALGPLLGAYFAYASEYDGKINFLFYGADAVMTIDEDDILEANDANGDNVTKNLRNNATEFPRRMIGQYYDPAQNYMPVTVMDVRRAAGVTATGDANIEIPVAMDADTAQQAVNKAMKCAYAQLEGTLEFSVPFAGKENIYLKLVPGDPVIFRGKRWIVINPITSNGYIKLTLQYDRQSAYTSDVQAIPGLDPTPPLSRYSGPTTLVPMNLPSLRPQDTYGVYLAAKGTDDQASWRGCNVLVSYDGQISWQNALTITTHSKMGTLDAEIPSGGEPLTVNIGDVDALESITDDQLAAQMNGFALGGADGFEIGQFKTAAQDSGGDWELTDVSRGELGTTEGTHAVGDPFMMLDKVYFLPIDLAFAGKTIYFRAVGFGEAVEDQPIVSLVYNPDTTVVIDGGEVT